MVVGDGVVSAPEERPDFAVVHGGQFPTPASPFSLFLVQEDFSVMAGDEDIFFDGDDWPSRFFQWQGGRVGGLAPWAHGAEQAGRGTGSAEALAEFHQGGVIRSHVLGGQQAFRPLPELALAGGAVDFDVEIHQSGEDAGHVAVDEWCWEVEGERHDGAGGVATDSGQGEQFWQGCGEDAVVAVDDDLGGFLQVTGAVVVSEAFPEGEDE